MGEWALQTPHFGRQGNRRDRDPASLCALHKPSKSWSRPRTDNPMIAYQPETATSGATHPILPSCHPA